VGLALCPFTIPTTTPSPTPLFSILYKNF